MEHGAKIQYYKLLCFQVGFAYLILVTAASDLDKSRSFSGREVKISAPGGYNMHSKTSEKPRPFYTKKILEINLYTHTESERKQCDIRGRFFFFGCAV
jgi:hypothetical protein